MKIPKADSQKIQNMTRFLSNATKSGFAAHHLFVENIFLSSPPEKDFAEIYFLSSPEKRSCQTHKLQRRGKGNTDLNDSESTMNYKNENYDLF